MGSWRRRLAESALPPAAPCFVAGKSHIATPAKRLTASDGVRKAEMANDLAN